MNVAPSPSDTISNPRQEGTDITVNGSATDPAGSNDTLTYSWEVFKGTATTAYASGGGTSLTFNPDDSGDFTVELTVSDEDGGTTTVSATIDVANLDPTAVDASASTDADENVVIDVLATATDPSSVDETILTVFGYSTNDNNWGEVGIVDDPTVGSALKYYPGDFLKDNLYLGHTVTDTFTYQAADDDGGQSANATVTVTVTGTESHDKYVKWNVDLGLGDVINEKLDELGQMLKAVAGVNPNLNEQAFANEGEFNSEVEGAVQSLAPDFGVLGDLVQGLKDSLGDWTGITVEGFIDGVVSYYKGYVDNMVDVLLPTFGGFLQDPILMGCNMKGAPVLGPSPPSLGGTVSLAITYENPDGQFTGPEWNQTGNNEPSDSPGTKERYTAIMNVKLSAGLNIRILGTAVNVQIQNIPIFSLEPLSIECEDGVEQAVVITT
ncbi:MAG: Ig-like domain-containing protein [Candidatus Paceibacterota bacterium]